MWTVGFVYSWRQIGVAGRHIWILLLISILTYILSSACDFASACQILPNQAIHAGAMTSYQFFKMVATESEIYFWAQV